MKLYNTATRQREDFIPNEPGKVSMYTCGPTVYHFAHIGNLRSYIMEDVLEKYFRYSGYDVTRVMNITDVGHLASDADEGEDKMLKGAKRENKSVMEIAKFYTDAFFSDCAKLNIKTPDVVEPATGCIDEFIKVIEGLIERDTLILRAETYILTPQSLKNTTYSTILRRRTLRLAFARALKRTQTRRIRTTSFFGLQSPSLRIRRSNGILLGA